MLPCIEVGKKSGEALVFMSGFPDDQLSACAPLVDELKKEYRIIAICFPDFDLKGSSISKARPWGYSFPEIDRMLDATICDKLGKTSQFTLVVHDWGSIIGGIYENKRSERVKRMVMLDVGIKKKLSPYEAVVILLYQLWFSIAYTVSQLFGLAIGNIVYYSFIVFATCFPFLTVQSGKMVIPRPREELGVHMCYPYFQFWKATLTLDPSVKVKFPSCPLLYLVKHAVFILLLPFIFIFPSTVRE